MKIFIWTGYYSGWIAVEPTEQPLCNHHVRWREFFFFFSFSFYVFKLLILLKSKRP